MSEKPEIQGNLIRKVARVSGVQDPKDAEGFVMGEKGHTQQEDVVQKESIEQILTAHQIDLELDIESLTDRERELLDEVLQFLGETSTGFRKEMWQILNYFREHSTAFTERIYQEVLERGYDSPKFTVFDKTGGDEFLKEIGVNDEVRNGGLMIVFNLPKPLAQWWWKGEGDWGDLSEEVHGMSTEWGIMYREVLPVIWEHKDEVDYNADSPIELYRINGIGAHDPLKFYYIWEVNLTSQPSI
jgi:hypothetical protein